MSLTFFSGGASLTGVRSSNQDRFRIVTSPLSGYDFDLWMVADGMGGHQDGDVAASTAVATFPDALTKKGGNNYEGHDDTFLPGLFIRAFELCHQAILKATPRGGTTLTVLARRKKDNLWFCYWSGDSALFHARVMPGKKVQILAKIEPHHLPKRPNIVTNYLGCGDKYLEPEGKQLRTPTHNNELFVLHSDGLDVFSSGEVVRHLLGRRSENDRAEKVCQDAVAAGSEDNCTLVFVRFGKAAP
jgi:serine/threonine protein phosphatase PrpC